MGKVSKVGGGPIGGESWIVPSGMVLKFPDGSATAPSLTFVSETTLGLYRLSSGNLSLATGNNLTIPATLGAELAPALTVANWDVVAGWDLTASTLNHSSAGAGAITPVVSIAPTAGVTYKVVITLSAATVENCSYSLGGTTGSLLSSATTHTDYITAADTTDLTFTPLTAASRFTISSVSVKALADATGDLTIEGNLNVKSPVTFYAGFGIPDINRTHTLSFTTTSDLTANRILTFVPGDASRTITLSGNPTLADWFDQAVKTSSTPIFPTLYGSASASGGLTLASTSHSTKGNISVGRLTLSDLANSDGIVFGNLGTATKGIDLSGSGLSGDDYLLYFSANLYLKADGFLVTDVLSAPNYIQATYLFGDNGLKIETVAGKDIRLKVTAYSSFLTGNQTPVGSLTACTRDTTATITKEAHGLTLAAGEMVHVTASTGSTDLGFYRIVSSTAGTIVVDRALSGNDSSVALTVYKDVISMHATDATNGQMFTSWSAQNKPMQLGGTVLAATGHSLTSPDILIGGILEVNGLIYADAGIDVASGQVYKLNNVQVVGARVIDDRCDDVVDATYGAEEAGVLDALRDAMIAHGLIAAA